MEGNSGFVWKPALRGAACAIVLAALLPAACAAERETESAAPETSSAGQAAPEPPAKEDLLRSLEEFAEMERAGSYIQGLGLAESGLREQAGDYPGAVAAAFKELSWAYGRGLIQNSALEQGLEKVLARNGDRGEENAAKAARGIFAFLQGRWDEAEKILSPLFDPGEEPDSFIRWISLACALEKNPRNRTAAAAYRSIRARYVQFQEYWYRGARAFSPAIAAEYAERCISLAPAGPFAEECRNILAVHAGLKPEDGRSLKSRTEIEDLVSRSVNQGNPELLAPLIPLISLPENPYTVYALGALRSVAAVPKFRDYFSAQAAASRGRLAERLSYICRG